VFRLGKNGRDGEIEAHLEELERLAKGEGLPPEEIRALRDEIAVHLDASIQARLETGEPPDEAASRAVQALGDPSEIVRRMADARPTDVKTGRRKLLVSLAATLGAYLYAFWSPANLAADVLLGALLVGLAFVATYSWKARRVQVRPFAALAFPMWLALSVVLSVHWVTLMPGDAPMMRLTPQDVEVYQRNALAMREQLRQFDAAYARFQRHGGLDIAARFDWDRMVLEMRPAKDAGMARRAWAAFVRFRPEMEANVRTEIEKARLAEASLTLPFWREIPNELGPALGIGSILMGLLFGFHLTVVFLRWLKSEIERTIRRARRATSRGGIRAR
jgi:hypothetical protein